MNYNKIVKLQETNRYSNREMAKFLKMSDTGYARMIANKTLAVDKLEILAELFKVPIMFFFDKSEPAIYTIPENQYSVEEPATPKCKMCEKLELIVESQRMVIALQEEKILMLEPKKEKLSKSSA